MDVALGVGDVVDIKVYREPDLAGIYRVGQAGAIDFPLIGSVRLAGRDAHEVANEIRSRLGDGYLQQPQVMIFVREYNSRKIHVLGQVTKAGSFGFKSGMSIIEAVAEAGGFTKLASTNRVRVTRGDTEAAFAQQGGDRANSRLSRLPTFYTFAKGSRLHPAQTPSESFAILRYSLAQIFSAKKSKPKAVRISPPSFGWKSTVFWKTPTTKVLPAASTATSMAPSLSVPPRVRVEAF